MLKTFLSLFKARLTGIIILCALLAVLVIILLIIGITWLTAYLSDFETGWINTAITIAAGILSGLGGWFMLPALTVLIGGIFQERIIHKVEMTYYPDSALKEDVKFWPDLWHDIRFTIRALFLNLIILPFYLFGFGFIISVLLNGYLLGREFFETAAGYHIGKPATIGLRKRYQSQIYLGGIVITLMNLTPFLNLLVPVLGPVWMIHVYHEIMKKMASDRL